VLDASGENGVRYDECIGKYHNSVFDLKVQEIWATDEDSNTIDLIDLTRPGFYEGDTIDVFMTLMGSQFDALERFSGDRELILAIGEYEILLQPSNDRQQFTLLDTSFLSLLEYEDYLTISLYQNNDSANVLWEFGFVINGLHVYHSIPGGALPSTEIKLEPLKSSKQRVRTLGGLRLKYEYRAPNNTAIEKVQWTFQQDGFYCLKPGVGHAFSDGCEFVKAGITFEHFPSELGLGDCTMFQCGIWWEPAIDQQVPNIIWEADKIIQANYVATTYNTFDIVPNPNPDKTQERDAEFEVVTRSLEPVPGSPMKGSDVEMLEALLWQLGYGPNYKLRGFKSIRIPAVQRNEFNVGCRSGLTGCSDTGPDSKATMEMMVWRFKFANAIDDLGSNIEDTTVDNRNVNNAMLKNLKIHWEDYKRATDFASNTLQFNYTHGDYQGWMDSASSQWNGIYDNSVHQLIMESLGHIEDPTKEQRWEIIDSIISNESGREQWGIKAVTPYRILQGGSDSHASPGFSQIKSRFVWGEKAGRLSTNGCSALKNVNIYKPDDAVTAVPLWSASANCGTSFLQAFSLGNSYDASYDNNGRYPKLVKTPTGGIILDNGLFTENTVVSYERLAKALAGYNQGARATIWQEFTWPELLKIRTKNCTGIGSIEQQCNGLKYVISDLKTEIRRLPDTNVVINNADYVWKDQGTRVNATTGLTEIFEFCFNYGETEWNTGSSWQTVRNAAEIDVTKQIICP